MKISCRHSAAAIAVAVTCALGCGETKPYNLAPVSGVVTLDGAPVPKAELTFQPQGSTDNPTPGPGSSARADDAGRFELTTIRNESGAVVGTHTVAIYSHRPPQPSASDVDVGPPRTEAIPARYNLDTKLTFTVPADGTSEANFDLTSDP